LSCITPRPVFFLVLDFILVYADQDVFFLPGG
jgi:hypothetical protein